MALLLTIHKTFESDCNLDKPWQEILKCRTCKYSLVKSIGQCLLKESRFWLIDNQLIILSGCFSGDEDNLAWIITSHNIGLPQPEPNYHTDSEEADLRIWRHATKCDGQNILIYSPDTDISIIGLQLLRTTNKKKISFNLICLHHKKKPT